MRFTLPKSEILRGFKSFTRVITAGKSISIPPIRCYYVRIVENPKRIQAGFSVSRSIRTAVDRNRAKRLMRESFRLNKNILFGEETAPIESLDVVFMYVGPSATLRRKRSFADVSSSMQRIMGVIEEGGR